MTYGSVNDMFVRQQLSRVESDIATARKLLKKETRSLQECQRIPALLENCRVAVARITASSLSVSSAKSNASRTVVRLSSAWNAARRKEDPPVSGDILASAF